MSNPLDYNDLLTVIADGEPVAAGVANRVPLQLDARTRYLWSLLQASAAGASVLLAQQAVASTVIPGTVVYWNAAHQQFEPATAAVVYDQTTGQLINAPTAAVAGVVLKKRDAVLADILFSGLGKLDITAALESGQVVTSGATYYLSRVTAGALTATRGPAPVPVLTVLGNGNVLVRPDAGDRAAAHTHAHFSLAPIPAGTHVPPVGDAPHVITDPNPHVEGWLPANHAVFAGHAPHDAKFGYNIGVNAGLKAAWPPLPPEATQLYQDGALVPAGVQGDALVIFDRYGIWWMSDCYDDVPWDPLIDTSYVAVSESTPVSETPTQCPFPYVSRLDLFFTNIAALTDQTVVTSAVSTDPRLLIYCQGGSPTKPAAVGPLAFGLALQFLADQIDPGGYLAIKGFTPATQTFHFGPVVPGVYALSDNVTLIGEKTSTQLVGATEQTVYQGRVGIDVQLNTDRELFPALTRLDGCTVEYSPLDVLYTSFPQALQTALRVLVNVPETLGLTSPSCVLKLRLLAITAGAMPQLVVTGRRLPDPNSTPTALPASDMGLTIDTTATATADLQYIEFTSDPFAVEAGDDLLFSIERLSSDAYASDLGLLRVSCLISPGA